MMTLNGLRVFVIQDAPKMQLSDRVCEVLKPDFIAEMNAWLLDFFGTTNPIADGQSFISNSSVFVNPRTYESLRQDLRVRNYDWTPI